MTFGGHFLNAIVCRCYFNRPIQIKGVFKVKAVTYFKQMVIYRKNCKTKTQYHRFLCARICYDNDDVGLMVLLLLLLMTLKMYKKAQLSLTNPRDACEKFAWFT